MTTVTVRRQGNSVGATFPAQTRIRMGFGVGQDLTLIELADGGRAARTCQALNEPEFLEPSRRSSPQGVIRQRRPVPVLHASSRGPRHLVTHCVQHR